MYAREQGWEHVHVESLSPRQGFQISNLPPRSPAASETLRFAPFSHRDDASATMQRTCGHHLSTGRDVLPRSCHPEIRTERNKQEKKVGLVVLAVCLTRALVVEAASFFAPNPHMRNMQACGISMHSTAVVPCHGSTYSRRGPISEAEDGSYGVSPGIGRF